jgi:hypothetical protein
MEKCLFKLYKNMTPDKCKHEFYCIIVLSKPIKYII